MLVFDLGGGTFDVSILDVGDGVVEVRATNGDGHLGGDDFDKRIVDWLAEQFKNDSGIDLRNDPQALQRLYEGAERAKVELSTTTQTQINLPFITADASGPKHLNTSLTRAKFEQLCADLFERCRGPVEQALSDAKLTADDIDEVILVGGSTRMPKVQELVRSLTRGKQPNMSVNPDEVVAIGAALQAGVLKGEVEDVVLLDVTPLSLGLETLGGVMTPVIERNTTIPARRSETFSTAEDNQTAVDILGAAGRARARPGQPPARPLPPRGHPARAAGMPQVEVTFDMDANGILNVSARDKETGAEQAVTINESTNLDAERSRSHDPRGPGACRPRTGSDARRSTPATSSTRSPTVSITSSPSCRIACPSTRRRGPSSWSATRARAIEEEAGLDRVRPLIADLQQLVASLPRARRRHTRPAARTTAARAQEERLTTRWSMQSSRAGDERRTPPADGAPEAPPPAAGEPGQADAEASQARQRGSPAAGGSEKEPRGLRPPGACGVRHPRVIPPSDHLVVRRASCALRPAARPEPPRRRPPPPTPRRAATRRAAGGPTDGGRHAPVGPSSSLVARRASPTSCSGTAPFSWTGRRSLQLG